jgi:hypothetical protein
VWQESERAVTKKEGIEFAREYGCLFLECSAKTKVNVEQCFEELVLKVCSGFQLLICSGICRDLFFATYWPVILSSRMFILVVKLFL